MEIEDFFEKADAGGALLMRQIKARELYLKSATFNACARVLCGDRSEIVEPLVMDLCLIIEEQQELLLRYIKAHGVLEKKSVKFVEMEMNVFMCGDSVVQVANTVISFKEAYILKSEDVKIFIHPAIKDFMDNEIKTNILTMKDARLTQLAGVDVVEGYEMAVIIAAPRIQGVEPVKVKFL